MAMPKFLQKFKKMHTPDCSQCEHYAGLSVGGYRLLCDCPKLSLAIRKCQGKTVEDDIYHAETIRGTKFCKFKRSINKEV